ncbi:hypothetical protein MPRF_04990 [Mycolicibacterium parafortuitum]|uniref:Uncharacterized protein n=1 Tax=Mycolicibacterium parafortuitum TaxID=39692 RepID=A0A7I7TWV7_MYCPF|nr:hypothetical protein MPRF_04990 [Mycolicibacterium parafortuitum]
MLLCAPIADARPSAAEWHSAARTRNPKPMAKTSDDTAAEEATEVEQDKHRRLWKGQPAVDEDDPEDDLRSDARAGESDQRPGAVAAALHWHPLPEPGAPLGLTRQDLAPCTAPRSSWESCR